MPASTAADHESPSQNGTLRAYVQLLRLPNVFTAMADLAMGFLLTHEALEPWPQFAALLVSSATLYLAGMVFNDFFDAQLDARQRPERPIPSGRVSPAAAARLGFALLATGVVAGWAVAAISGQLRAGLVATALAALVFLYDWALKPTLVAPLAMGGCRLLNVLLGMSLAAGPWQWFHYVVAGGIGLYIVGLTWFARSEARLSRRGELAASTLVMLAGIALVAAYPRWRVPGSLPAIEVPEHWSRFWAVIAALIALRCVRAVVDPRPAMVQIAVKTCLLSLIVIDAAAVFAMHGPFWAAIVLSLLVPAMFLGQWIYST